MKHQCNDDDHYDDEPADEVAAGGGGVGERPLGEKLPGQCQVKTSWGETRWLHGGIELHRLAVEDFDQLERRADEINEENLNSTCSDNDGYYKEVSQTPLPNSSPGDATVPRLPVPSLGLGTPAAEQGC